ncbi:PPOX class F420-dependent oxidoreductase [Lapillicoccus jejuensis]|uniref:PPOX class probable F420-dependent enzyme n=1 Tax=Lapillicoccus jejuensis TaxID=402171 RepID=A0A542DZX8_9MICO|nr:PPOX class F420-dependent oxidoreductase [Lapillicoccus jejuensis]TQJ08606.1 PPOX class probable F420-dependent enzyme [Lapillicoccus jejuensis]
MRDMTRDEWREFVLTGTRTGKIAVVRKDGQPLVTPIWFLLDEGEEDGTPYDELVFTTHESGAKARIIRRDPRVCVLVDDQAPPYSYVQLQGEARLSEDLDELRTWATRLGARYMGEDVAEAFGERNAVPGESLVRMRITRVVALADVSD